ncbi:uncharacterized protein B0H64DRAFT_216389 [Chaetomium fimeti]|uniref:Uncharacterized protein n=1 Tax=Chaetomium fimeti TaxID=1854472 RepID=A0AAE0HDG0_9PEZI|nr:hypothetical protein B0H64DRAFT_216389 [Chaetomium fimeti]
MSQEIDRTLQLSGEDQPSGDTSYSLERYLNSDGGVAERLLRGLDVGGIVGRAQTVGGEVNKIAGRAGEQPKGSS